MEDVGLIGVGLLGSAIAERLLIAGHRVRGYDVRPDRLRWLSDQGGEMATDAHQLVENRSLILLSLPDSRAVRQMLDDVAEHLQRGTLVLDTTTGSPADAEDFARQMTGRQIEYAELTIVGSSEQVRLGQCLALVGAPESSVPRIEQISRRFAERTVHIGKPGQAGRMKLAVNLVLGLHRAVLAEGLSFAHALGLNQQLTLDVLKSSAAYSRVMDTKGSKMIAGDYTPQARLAQHLKDVSLMLEQAQQLSCELPLTTVHRTLLQRGIQLGLSELDNAAIRRVYESLCDSPPHLEGDPNADR